MRHRSGVRRVGHAGTLDPAATGVLVLCLGQATRLIEYLMDATKAYVAEVTLGVSTNTYDADGEVTATNDASRIRRAAIEAALALFRGDFEQAPPPFSALKRDGVPLYKLARRGEAVTPAPRPVRVDRLDITSYKPPIVRLEIECSKGFYVRSLAHDLGARLHVGGMLSGLVRTRVGPFSLAQAVGIDTLRAELASGEWTQRLIAPDEILLGWQAAIVGEANERRLRTGQPATFDAPAAGAADRCRAYTSAGDFLAVLRRGDTATWRSEKVFGP